MKKNLLSIILLSLAITSFGQIVITNDDLAPVGTSVFMAYDTLPAPEIVPGEAGANKTWDFTNVTVHILDTFNLVLPVATPYSDEFPDANFAVISSEDDTTAVYSYMVRNSDKLVATGTAIEAGEEDTLFLDIQPEDVLLDFPVSYGNNYDESFIINILLASPEPGADSVWMKTNIEKETEVDAWGSLSIPMGTYNVLRQRVDEFRIDSIFFKMFGDWMFITASEDSSTSYSWWTNDVNIGFDLFAMDVEHADGDVWNVSFMNSMPVGWFENKSVEARVFPNPVTDVLHIEFDEPQSGELTVLNQLGQVVFKEKISAQSQFQFNLSSLPAGLYLYSLRNTSVEVTTNGKFLKR